MRPLWQQPSHPEAPPRQAARVENASAKGEGDEKLGLADMIKAMMTDMQDMKKDIKAEVTEVKEMMKTNAVAIQEAKATAAKSTDVDAKDAADELMKSLARLEETTRTKDNVEEVVKRAVEKQANATGGWRSSGMANTAQLRQPPLFLVALRAEA